MFRKFGAIFICITLTACNSEKNVSGSLFLMDTLWNISVQNEAVYQEISDTLKKADVSSDCISENGECYRLNEKGTLECSDYLYELVCESSELSEKYGNKVSVSCGALTDLWRNTDIFPDYSEINDAVLKSDINNVSVEKNNTITLLNGCKLDTGAFAKGFALDKCCDVLKKNDSERAVISAVSSVLMYDGNKDGQPFEVQVKNPDGEGIIGKVYTNRSFVSTSGSYERFFVIDGKKYCHIVDTETGRPSESDLLSVTVFCDSGILSDYLSTLIFVEGLDNIEKYLESDDFEVVAFDVNGECYLSNDISFKYE